MWKSFWWASKVRYLVKDIKTYKKVSTNERGSKDLLFYSEGWENSDEYGFAFLFIIIIIIIIIGN